MGKPLEYNATLVERIDMTDKLAIFRVQPDADWGVDKSGQIPDFEGGQYVALGLNNQDDPEKGAVIRPYSIASPPEEKRFLEFYIRYVEQPESENPLTHLLWRMQTGDRLHLGRKITGHFTLGRTIGADDQRLKVFVAAGTGLAPFISIIGSYIRQGKSPDCFAVLHGACRPEDLGYREELKMIFNDLPHRYAPTVSRPQDAPDWCGDCGRVETFFDNEKLGDIERRLGMAEGELTPERAVVYICGLYGTIHCTLVRLMRRGFVPNDRTIRKGLGLDDVPASLFFEQYDNTTILDVRNRDEMERLLADTPFASRLVKDNA